MPSAEETYEFRHVVTRDAAYQMLLPSERGDLHRIVVDHFHATLDDETRGHAAAEVLQHIDAIDGDDLRELEFLYLRHAAKFARTTYQSAKAARYLRRVIDHELADTGSRIEAAQLLGSVLLGSGETKQAADVLTAALEEAKQAAPQSTGSIRGALAGVYMEGGRTDEAEELFEQAVADCRASGDDVALGRALTNRAILFRHIGKDIDHEALLKEALEVHRRVGKRTQEGLTLMALGGVYRTADESVSAEDYYNQALEIFRELGDRPLEAQVWGNLANVYLVTERIDEAATAYMRALKVMRELGRRRSEAILLGNYGQLLEKQGRLNASVAASALSVALFERTNDLMLLQPFRSMLASGLMLRGRFEEADALFGKIEQELAGDANVGALDHVLPALFRFRLAQASGGYGPGRDPGAPDPARLEDAAEVLRRIRAANTAKASKLTRVVDRDSMEMSKQLNDLRARVEAGKPALRFNNEPPDKLDPPTRKALLAWLRKCHPDQLRWMREHNPELHAAMLADTEDLPEPDWRSERILD